ncbi:MAG: protein kinase [Vicinamibacterales bacterium]|nr:protein kinase [Vicinamibacterales bacterium]
MALPVGSRLGPYEISALLGVGGMGEVYRARDTRLGRTVALKVLPSEATADPERRQSFEEEARTVAALNHPNICVLYDIGESVPSGLEGLAPSAQSLAPSPVHYLVMEHLDGKSLAERLVQGPLPLEQALDVAIQMSDALDKAHDNGVVHRDLSPANVMLTKSGAKLLDFGLATLVAPEPGHDPGRIRTHLDPLRHRLIGTPYYMSPEQAKGQPADCRSDIFGMGVLLYEMVTGKRPFDGTNLVTILASILRDTQVPVTRVDASLPLQLGPIVDKCLEKEPARRWQTAAQLQHRLESLRADLQSAVRANRRSIAVLPFADMSEARDQAYLCEGIAEEILIALGRVKGLRVASRAAAFRYRRADADPMEIGATLQVSTLLDGTVRRSGDRIRITVTLVAVDDGFSLWSERYDRDVRDIFALQDEIARAVVNALEITLSSAEREAAHRLSTPNLDAYDAYLRGRSYFFKFDKRSVGYARELFEQAIAVDPAYGRAYAGISDCSAYLYMNVGRNPADLERAVQAAEAALKLAPDMAEAQSSLGTALSLLGRHAEAEAAFQQAIALNPNLFEAHYFYARDSFAEGKLDQAIREYEEASRVRPEDYQSPLLVAQSYEDLGHPDLARMSRLRGVAIAESHLKLTPDDARALYMGANGLVALGEVEKGLEWATRAVGMGPDDPMLLYNVACIFSMANRVDEALGYVEAAVAAGMRLRGWLEHDSNLDNIRNTPRFQAVMAKL